MKQKEPLRLSPDPGAQLAGLRESTEWLRELLTTDELRLYCQPIAALSGSIRFPMAEVLVRMRAEENAMLPPGDFLPAFEQCGLMPNLDRWVACDVIRHLARGSRIAKFSVNVSAQTLSDVTFPQSVAIELVSAGVPGTALLFEVSEEDCIAHLEPALKFAKAIRAVGCGLIVDGCGLRTKTFTPLKKLRPEFVKIDGAIVRNLLGASGDQEKLKALLRVSRAAGFEVIAEMVENQDILIRLKALGVGYVQGFGIMQPHPIELVADERGRLPCGPSTGQAPTVR